MLLLVQQAQTHLKRFLCVHEEEEIRYLTRLQGWAPVCHEVQVFKLEVALLVQFTHLSIRSNLGKMEAVNGHLGDVFEDRLTVLGAKLLREKQVSLEVGQLSNLVLEDHVATAYEDLHGCVNMVVVDWVQD